MAERNRFVHMRAAFRYFAKAIKLGGGWFAQLKSVVLWFVPLISFIVLAYDFCDLIAQWWNDAVDPIADARIDETIPANASKTRRAVLVGVDDYAFFSDLKYASADVELIRERLLTLGFAEENVVALTTQAGKNDAALLPNLENIERELTKTLDATGPNDAVFFFFSGHGFQTPAFDGFAPYVGFAPFDATRKGNGVVDFASTFSLSRFFERLAKTEAGFKWVVVDACREKIGPNASGASSAERRRGGLSGDSTSLGLLAAPSGSVILQSCDEGQYSYEDDALKHGVFTYCLAESLTEKGDTNGDGEITLLEVVARTLMETKRVKPTQTPYVDIKATDVGLIAGIKTDGANPQVAASLETPNRTKTDALSRVAERTSENVANDVDANAPRARAEETESARLYRLGRALAFGLDGRKIDQAAGFERLKEATDLGSFDAQAELAELYLNGCVGTKADPAEAFDLATDPANAGNPFAQNVLAVCYRDGLSARQSEAKALKLFQDACAGFRDRVESDVRAATALGEHCLDGEGVEKDEEAAARFFLTAAEADYVPAMTRLAACYANGTGVEQDFEKATKWFLKAAELNDATAMTRLGTLYERGAGVALDRAAAARWYREAARQGNDEAASHLTALEEYERRAAEIRSGLESDGIRGWDLLRSRVMSAF